MSLPKIVTHGCVRYGTKISGKGIRERTIDTTGK
jgi:hypothetical protein